MSAPVLVHEILSRSAQRATERPFLLLPEYTITYRQTDGQSNRTGRGGCR